MFFQQCLVLSYKISGVLAEIRVLSKDRRPSILDVGSGVGIGFHRSTDLMSPVSIRDSIALAALIRMIL